jgi:hypothetical protein
MGKIMNKNELVQTSEKYLDDVRAEYAPKIIMSVPITELSSLGAGVASLIPQLNTITQTKSVDASGFYTLANAAVGDTLKAAKDGTYWGSLKCADGSSKMLKVQSANSMIETTKTTMINPANMMMAVALYSIEKELGTIADLEKQILSFLETEKESEIEADVETLMKMAEQYKYSWDNEKLVTNNHKLVKDIQRTARKNMKIYQKQLADSLKAKHFTLAQLTVNNELGELEKKFKYFRLSLYTFSLASFMEIMLSGNYKEEYIVEVRDEINCMSEDYRELFEKCSLYLEKRSKSVVSTNVIKAVGKVEKATGKLLGNIPKKGDAVEDFLQGAASSAEDHAMLIERQVVREFAMMNNPGTRLFTTKMDDMIRIYNHTSSIYFDEKNIYLKTGEQNEI